MIYLIKVFDKRIWDKGFHCKKKGSFDVPRNSAVVSVNRQSTYQTKFTQRYIGRSRLHLQRRTSSLFGQTCQQTNVVSFGDLSETFRRPFKHRQGKMKSVPPMCSWFYWFEGEEDVCTLAFVSCPKFQFDSGLRVFAENTWMIAHKLSDRHVCTHLPVSFTFTKKTLLLSRKSCKSLWDRLWKVKWWFSVRGSLSFCLLFSSWNVWQIRLHSSPFFVSNIIILELSSLG